MKIKDVAHNHSLTDLLKVTIFSLLMLAPMINVGVRSAYVICNKNAYQSYGAVNESPYEDIQIDSFTNLKNGETYKFTSSNTETINNNATKRLYIENINITMCSNPTFASSFANTKSITTTWYDNIAYLIAYDVRGNSALDMNSNSIIFTFTLENETHPNNTYSQCWDSFLSVRHYNTYYTLDNVFEYSVSQLTESPLYNWVENTAIYSGVALMNTQLGITQPVISLLVVYWLLLTIIYVIIDIILKVFTWLTHMIGSKTA